MLKLPGPKATLCDFAIVHLPQRIKWETTDTQWQQWDAPWLYEGRSEPQLAADLQDTTALLSARARQNMSLPEGEPRWGFEVLESATGRHIGWVNAYSLTEDFDYSQARTERTAVGIDLPPQDVRGKGLGTAALGMFIDYLLTQGHAALYTQTWSGNEAMIALARRLGFVECCRKPGLRQVRGQSYDGLTFRLERG